MPVPYGERRGQGESASRPHAPFGGKGKEGGMRSPPLRGAPFLLLRRRKAKAKGRKSPPKGGMGIRGSGGYILSPSVI